MITVKWFRLASLSGAVFMSGCKNKSIIVVDEAGRAVPGAVVVVSAPSFSGTMVLTDSEGRADVDAGLVGAKYVNVSKEGYESGVVALPAQWPIQAVLRKKC